MTQLLPFAIGEIAVFEGDGVIWLERVKENHIPFMLPNNSCKITKATPDQKKEWFESGVEQFVIKDESPEYNKN